MSVIDPASAIASGLRAQMEIQAIIAQNSANANSIGYQELTAYSVDTAWTQLKNPGVPGDAESFGRPAGIERGTGSTINAVMRNTNQGPIKTVTDPLSVAINGAGYIAVTLPNGVTGYTRAGNFRLSSTRALVTSTGIPLADGITIPNDIDINTISIDNDGTMVAKPVGSTETVPLGQIQLAVFPNEQGMSHYGQGILLATEASGEAEIGVPGDVGFGTIQHKAIEESNVDPVNIVIDIVKANRAYELNSKILQAVNDMAKQTNDMLK